MIYLGHCLGGSIIMKKQFAFLLPGAAAAAALVSAVVAPEVATASQSTVASAALQDPTSPQDRGVEAFILRRSQDGKVETAQHYSHVSHSSHSSHVSHYSSS
jgi:poly(3-hydroxybutyrate) depolymerase